MDIQADFDRDMDEERRQMRRERISKMKLLKETQIPENGGSGSSGVFGPGICVYDSFTQKGHTE